MSLDLTKTAKQLGDMSEAAKFEASGRLAILNEMLSLFRDWDHDGYLRSIRDSSDTLVFSGADIDENPATVYPSIPIPDEYTVIGVDGSHIDVNRHIPVSCFLINTGAVTLKYGSKPLADLVSNPTLYSGYSSTTIKDPSNSASFTKIQGALLGAVRSVEEIKYLESMLGKISSQHPVIGLVDGTLVMLDLLRSGIPEYVVQQVLSEGFIGALDRIKKLSSVKDVSLASYISLPGSSEVIDSVWDAKGLLSKTEAGLKKQAESGTYVSTINGIRDRDIFAKLLEPGWRSSVFGTSYQMSHAYYGENRVSFFYINVGEEIGRVEMPQWVAMDIDKVNMVQTLILDQCIRGSGYPASLMEAHEQAVISTADRTFFLNILEESLESNGISFNTSQKDRTKRLRWL